MKESIQKLSPIQQTDTINQIVKSLQDYIINGNLTPGTEIPPERTLSETLGVSRFTLREALRVAQAQGLIEINQGKRPRVAKPTYHAAADIIALTLRRTKKTFIDLIIAREGLEYQIVKLAAQNIKPTHIKSLEKLVRTMEEHKDDLEYCTKLDGEFHDTILEASDNMVFEIMLAPLTELLRESRFRTLKGNGVDIAITGHKEVLEALKKRDSEVAADAMKRHLEMAEKDLRRNTR